jgi:hypothetical protein
VPEPNDCTDQELLVGIDAVNGRVCASQRELLRFIAEVDRREVWQDSGARDMAHWLVMRYEISYWKASRWIQASHGLKSLPLISQALASGALGIDKVVELTRFATPETEARLVVWAQGVSCGCIREKGDLAHRSLEEAQEAERARSLSWWYFEENSRFGLSAELPAAEGAVVAKALEHLADQLPVMPGEDGQWSIEARRADALVALCSARIAEEADPDRATVVIHARVEELGGELHSCEIEGGSAIHPEVARRLACNGRIQTVIEDRGGQPVRLGRISRMPPDWMVRQLRYRDRECTFPGCGGRQFTQAHHIVWWEHWGRTDLDNLVLVCSFHHKLVHEYGWTLLRDGDGTVRWFHPDGTRYRAGPAPPETTIESRSDLLALTAIG